MLVLTRLPGEKIVINKVVVVTIVKIKGNKVKVGVEAPDDIPVVREELLDQAQQTQQAQQRV